MKKTNLTKILIATLFFISCSSHELTHKAEHQLECKKIILVKTSLTI